MVHDSRRSERGGVGQDVSLPERETRSCLFQRQRLFCGQQRCPRMLALYKAAFFITITLLVAAAVFSYPFVSLPSVRGNGNTVREFRKGAWDAVVIIALDRVAEGIMLQLSLALLRDVGRWEGPIFVLTDRPHSVCPNSTCNNGEFLLTVPSQSTVIQRKKYKTAIYEYVPREVNTILYMDADILIGESLEGFSHSVAPLMGTKFHVYTFPEMYSQLPPAQRRYPWEARGFDGLQKHHTGVLLLSRNQSQPCLTAWGALLDKYKLDQQSFGYLVQKGVCRVGTLPAE